MTAPDVGEAPAESGSNRGPYPAQTTFLLAASGEDTVFLFRAARTHPFSL